MIYINSFNVPDQEKGGERDNHRVLRPSTGSRIQLFEVRILTVAGKNVRKERERRKAGSGLFSKESV